MDTLRERDVDARRKLRIHLPKILLEFLSLIFVIFEFLGADEQIFEEIDRGHEGESFGLIEPLEDRRIVRQGNIGWLDDELRFIHEILGAVEFHGVAEV